MKSVIKKWLIRLFLFGLVSFLTVVLAVFNPSFLYANKTEVGNYTVYHHNDLSPAFKGRLATINSLIEKSELYDATFKTKICLNDGSYYPEMMEKLRGAAFGWGFYNITTFRGNFDFEQNTVEFGNYKWNLEQLITHELTHCLQFNTLGFFNANPLGNHPNWKWEGYPEYVSRKKEDQLSLLKNIQRIELARNENPEAWGVLFEDGTASPRFYYDAWLLVQYCLDIKGMTYLELLNSPLSRTSLEEEMYNWCRERLETKD